MVEEDRSARSTSERGGSLDTAAAAAGGVDELKEVWRLLGAGRGG